MKAMQIRKPLIDLRQYKLLTLKNNLKCLLVSDQNEAKASASISVLAGSLHNPRDYQGLAHFLEHMLSKGSERHPEEEKLSKLCKSRTGYSNAYTSEDHTNYYFSIENSSFFEALDIFSAFFEKPLFSKDLVEREIHAVDSEHNKNIPNDIWRDMRMRRVIMPKSSIFNAFSTGNYSTLHKEGLLENMIKFYEQYYAASRMNLVVVANYSLEALEDKVVELFSNVPDFEVKGIEVENEPFPFDQSNLGKIHKIVPNKKGDVLYLHWPFKDDVIKQYKDKPHTYITGLLGHEAENTIKLLLERRGWITSLNCGTITNVNHSLLYMKIKMTEEGMDNWEEVVRFVLSAIEKLRKEGYNQNFSDERRKESIYSFDYKDLGSADTVSSSFSPLLRVATEEDILSYYYTVDEQNPERVLSILNQVTDDNLFIFLCSKRFQDKTNLIEEFYGINYSSEDIPEALFERVDVSEVGYPPVNEFLPSDFSIKQVEVATNKQKLIIDDEFNRVYFKQDSTFKTPKLYITIDIALDKSLYSYGKYRVLGNLYEELVRKQLNTVYYLMEQASTKFSFNMVLEGANVQVKGFNEAAIKTARLMLKKIRDMKFDSQEKEFDLEKEEFIKNCINTYKQTAYNLVRSYVDVLIRVPNEESIKLADIAKDVTFEDFLEFVDTIYAKTHSEWMILGNATESEIKKLVKECSHIINKESESLKNEERVEVRCTMLEKGSLRFELPNMDESNTNSCMLSVFSLGEFTYKKWARAVFLKQLLSDKFFSTLRTQEGLGYVVFLIIKVTKGNLMIELLVQGQNHTPEYILSRINNSIKTELDNFLAGGVTLESFEEIKNAILADLRQPPTSLLEEFNQAIKAQNYKNYEFDYRTKIEEEIKKVELKEVIEFYEKNMYSEAKRIDFSLTPSKFQSENDKLKQANFVEEIQSINAFQRSHKLSPTEEFIYLKA